MRIPIVAYLVVLATWPAAGAPVVTVQVERKSVPATAVDQVVPFEIFATNPNEAENERLNAFTIAIHATTMPGDSYRPRFVTPPVDPATGVIAYPMSTVHPYVFEDYPGNGPVDPVVLSGVDDAYLSAALGDAGQEVDITGARNGFGVVNVLFPAGWSGRGLFQITLVPQFLSLGGVEPNIVAVAGPPGGIELVIPDPDPDPDPNPDPGIPEPSMIGLIAPLGLLALRRRAEKLAARRRDGLVNCAASNPGGDHASTSSGCGGGPGAVARGDAGGDEGGAGPRHCHSERERPDCHDRGLRHQSWRRGERAPQRVHHFGAGLRLRCNRRRAALHYSSG